MTGPDPAVAATRCAVRDHLSDKNPGDLVLVGVSGGADSMALLAAAIFESRKSGVQIGAVIVDHGMQPGSAEVAAGAAEAVGRQGAEPVDVRCVQVAEAGGGGPEARARTSRYAVFEEARVEHGAVAVWLGHTRDDQAEQVVLGLLRGSGARSLAGMARRRPPYERPLLSLPRTVTRAACRAQGLPFWDDPSNDDPAFRRNTVRRLLASWETELGGGLVPGLVRTAELARDDADLLDDLAAQARDGLGEGPWPVSSLRALPRALRGRVWRILAKEAGCAEIGAAHVAALDALVTAWRGQKGTHLPGGRLGERVGGFVRITHPSGQEWTPDAP